MKSVTVFIGGFGSGKTESALNAALRSAADGKKTALLDMDVHNPMFKSSFQEALLERSGVTLISPESSRTNAESPSITPEVVSAFEGVYDVCIFDVGGDSIGARVLGQLHRMFEENVEQTEILFVVNVRRPATDTVEHITGLLDRVQRASRLQVTGIVNNANLSVESTPELLLEGDAILREVTAETGIPVLYHSGTENVLRELEERYPNAVLGQPVCLELVTKPGWLTFYCDDKGRKKKGGVQDGNIQSQ